MLRKTKVLMIFLIGFVIFTGCSRIEKLMDAPAELTPIDESGSDMAASSVKFVKLIDYPEDEGGKNASLQWMASIAPTLQAPEEVLRIRFYENVEAGISPHWYVAFEFESIFDAATYMDRPEIAAILEDSPNRSSQTFIQRSAYQKIEADDAPVIGILLITYRLGGRDAYLQWAESVSGTIIASPQLQALATYENYYGEPLHRLVEGAFASQADADAHEVLADIQAIVVELDTRAERWIAYRFELRSDYIR